MSARDRSWRPSRACMPRRKRRHELDVQLLFLEAESGMLLQRFSETRRPHRWRRIDPRPRGERGAGTSAADSQAGGSHRRHVETGACNELKKVVVAFTGQSSAPQTLTANIVSFGFRRGVPHDADLMFDVRFLANPHFVQALRPLSGLDRRVSRFVLNTPPAREFLKRTLGLLQFLVPHYIEEGKTYLTIAVGCTGGRHRSVAIAEAIAKQMRKIRGVQIRVQHRDVNEGERREGVRG